MANLSSIRPCILDLSGEAALQIHLDIRKSRMTPKRTKSKATKKKIAKKNGILTMLAKMDPAEAERLLLAQLEGK